MTKLRSLESEIRQLPPEEPAELREWFDRFQVQLSVLAPIGEDDPQEPPYRLCRSAETRR